jgi:hypothetical protein
MYMHIHMYIYTHVHTYICTYTNTYIHTYVHTNTLNPSHPTDAVIPAMQEQRGKGAIE